MTTAQTIDLAWVEEFEERWLAAWNSHEPETLLDLMTDDIVYDDSAWPETMRGKAMVREFLDHTWRAFPDLTFEAVGSAYLGPSAAAFWWRGRGTHTGPIDPPGIPPTGNVLDFEGGDFHEYRDGKVSRLRIVFDMAELGRGLGLFPPRGSAAERTGVKLLQLRSRLGR